MKEINLVVRFLLELTLLASAGYGGFQLGTGIWKWVFAIGFAILITATWGIWIAPHSNSRLEDPWRFGLEVILFAIGVIAIWFSRTSLSIAFGVVVAANLTLMFFWHQR